MKTNIQRRSSHRLLHLPLRAQHRGRGGLPGRRAIHRQTSRRGGLARLQVHVLRSGAGVDPAGHPRAPAQPRRRGVLLAAAARAHVPQRCRRGRTEPVLFPDGQHPRARFVGALPTARRPRRRPSRSRTPPICRVRFHGPLETTRVPIHPDVLVVGGGIAGIHAALTLGNAGKKVFLVEREPSIGGHMAQFDKTFPTLDCAACILTPKMSAVRSHENITLWTYSEVVKVSRATSAITRSP